MLQRPTPRLILASASTSRRALLTAAGLSFAVQPAPIDEAAAKRSVRASGATAAEAALLLADLKARHVAQAAPDAMVIGADQILVCDGAWFDKPPDIAAAREQLRTLRGRSHELATAVVCQAGQTRVWHHIAQPHLTMRDASDAFIDAYLQAEGDDVTGTVGAYRLEGRGAHLFIRVEGEHSAVLGLPLLPLLAFLRQHGVLMS
ncbi:MAG TPA: Maf family nucleotide pyrophosphatase [Acetobacteraceae bacterium]|jgi:septum formation protein|nr:Maf family nucleotide pyrophosphatase [Acetobacteraceae bacterium]